jgi:hypothetical protein
MHTLGIASWTQFFDLSACKDVLRMVGAGIDV